MSNEQTKTNWRRWWRWLILIVLVGCEANAQYIVPTAQPTATVTYTPSPTRTPARDITPSPRPTNTLAPGQATPTPLFGTTRTPTPVGSPIPTRILNPTAPRIEFFTSDVLAIEPGGEITLYWSVRNVDNAVIYRLNRQGERTQVYNIPPEGSLVIATNRRDRGQIDFVLTVGENTTYAEQTLTIPLQCPVAWFFDPAPEDCPDTEPEATRLVEQPFERGRMIFAEQRNVVYILFNDGQAPAWLTFENRYDPAIHPERDPNAPPQFIQPIRELGLIWRTTEVVRNRLGLGLAEGVSYEGAIQTITRPSGNVELFMSSSDGNILQLLPGGEIWQIIAPIPQS